MSAELSCYAALILPDATGLDPAPYLAVAADVVDRNDPMPDSPPHVSPEQSSVSGDTLCLTIDPQEDSDYGPRVVITARATPNARYSEERAAQLLSDTVLACLKICEADIVEWFAPDTLLDAEDFVRLRSYVSPRRGSETPSFAQEMQDEEDDYEVATVQRPERSAKELELIELFRQPVADGIELEPPAQLTDRLLAHCEALRDEEPSHLRMAAAGWAMTGTVALMSPPMGASMTVLGLARGLDFRRVTQALTLTAFFVVLQQQGLIAKLAGSLIH